MVRGGSSAVNDDVSPHGPKIEPHVPMTALAPVGSFCLTFRP